MYKQAEKVALKPISLPYILFKFWQAKKVKKKIIMLSDVLISIQTFRLAICIDRYKLYMITGWEDGWFYSFYNLIYSESDNIFFLLITFNTNHTPYKIKHLYKSFLYSVWWNGTMKIPYMVVDSAPPFHSDVNNWLKSTINKRERKTKGATRMDNPETLTTLGSQYTGRRQTQDVNLIIVYDTIITQAWQIMKNNHNNFWNNIRGRWVLHTV